MLSIKNLHVSINKNNVIKGLNLNVRYGEIHVIMGQNGSGKSTLSSTLAGKRNFLVTSGKIKFKGFDLLKLEPEKRALNGLFISFQYPVEIPGISNQFFLHTSVNAMRKYRNLNILDKFDFLNFIKDKIKLLKMPKDLLTRSVNVGFSGGEKKRNDILQMLVLEPDLCILDEIDSGLDIDALKIISNSINTLCNKKRSFIIITHYQRILNYIKPNYVHVLHQGQIVKSGNFSLVKQLEEKGYGWINK